MSHTSFVIQNEVNKFSAIASSWWQTNGDTKALQALNTVRANFISQHIALHFSASAQSPHSPQSPQHSQSPQPFSPQNIKMIDVGCGGGLLTEAMFNKGFTNITGIDVSLECINEAKAHAQKNTSQQNAKQPQQPHNPQQQPHNPQHKSTQTQAPTQSINYFHKTINQAAAHASATQNKYDAVLCMEVIEHVNDFEGFLKQCASLLKPNGLIFVATINKTPQSLMFAKIAAEYILSIVPKNTHDWNKFVKPHQIVNALESPDANCKIKQSTGVSYNPATNHAQLCSSLNINYMMMFEKQK